MHQSLSGAAIYRKEGCWVSAGVENSFMEVTELLEDFENSIKFMNCQKDNRGWKNFKFILGFLGVNHGVMQ
jgi:hypothetical protein